MALTPDSAARYVRVAQIGAIAAAALAGGVFIVPAGDPQVTPPEPSVRPTAGGAGSEAEEKESFDPRLVMRQDWTTLVPDLKWATPENLRQLAQDGEQDESAGENGEPEGGDGEGEEGVEVAGEGDGEEGEAESFRPRPAIIANWRYLGPALASRAPSALMQIGSAQRFVSRGQRIEGYTFAEIDPGRVILEGDGGRYEIALAEGTGGAAGGSALGGPMTPEEAREARQSETPRERLERLREIRERQRRQAEEANQRQRDGAPRR